MAAANKPFYPKDKVIIVTGAASGIGASLVTAFCRAGAKAVVACDINYENTKAIADKGTAAAKEQGFSTETYALRTDCSKESDIRKLINATEGRFGPIDLFVANAGITNNSSKDKFLSLVDTTDEEWDRVMKINFMQSVYAARHVIPRMVNRGSGHFFITSSASGLLTSFGDATYAVSKHAVLAFAEILAIEYGEQGVGVTVLAPQGVETEMTRGLSKKNVVAVDGMLTADKVALDCLATLEEGKFLVLPHPKVHDYFIAKAKSHDRWIKGSRKLVKLTSRI